MFHFFMLTHPLIINDMLLLLQLVNLLTVLFDFPEEYFLFDSCPMISIMVEGLHLTLEMFHLFGHLFIQVDLSI